MNYPLTNENSSVYYY